MSWSEGFTNLFTDVLKVPNPSLTRHSKIPNSGSRVISSSSKECRTGDFGSTIGTVYNSGNPITPKTPSPLLKQIILNEKESVESLLKVAAKIGPVVNTIVEKEKAYDAAFESEVPAPLPSYGSSLQGFALLLFFVSYAALIIVLAIYINATTNNAAMAGGTFIGMFILAFIMMGLLRRYG